MNQVYIVQHVHNTSEGDEEIKLIGAYSSESNAREAIRRLSALPGFRDHVNGFHISSYELDQDHWTEGFISWQEALEDKKSTGKHE